MELEPQQLAAALDNIASSLGQASKSFSHYVAALCASNTDDWSLFTAEKYLEKAYSQLLLLTEALDIPVFRMEIEKSFEEARRDGLSAIDHDPDGNEYQKWATPASRYLDTLRSIVATAPARTITRDLEFILRNSLYSITDSKIFQKPPPNERTLHFRIESILRCSFPDLKHKPKISKPIKNFEPDTGLPSIKTLIEYKFIDNPEKTATVAEGILADTRGYSTPEWEFFIYLLYETRRFRSELEWQQLLRKSGVGQSTNLIVLSGEPGLTPSV